MSFRPVLASDALWDDEMTRVEVEGLPALLVRIDGCVHAYRDACMHKGVPLSRGTLCGRRLTCSAHQWQYDVVAGCGINPAGVRLARLPVRVRDGKIEIDPSEIDLGEIDPGATDPGDVAPGDIDPGRSDQGAEAQINASCSERTRR